MARLAARRNRRICVGRAVLLVRIAHTRNLSAVRATASARVSLPVRAELLRLMRGADRLVFRDADRRHPHVEPERALDAFGDEPRQVLARWHEEAVRDTATYRFHGVYRMGEQKPVIS